MRVKFLTDHADSLQIRSVLSVRSVRLRKASVNAMRACIFAMIIGVPALAQTVGNIPFDQKTDDASFQLCNSNWVWQGYQLKTMADETSLAVDREFKSKFTPAPEWKDQSGIIRIRFIVNCNGKSDRFRLLCMGSDMKEKQFNEDLKAHVIKISKQIQWPVRRAQQQTVDYYHYFSIRIVDGQLKEVLQ